jgi:hypothetical protein
MRGSHAPTRWDVAEARHGAADGVPAPEGRRPGRGMARVEGPTGGGERGREPEGARGHVGEPPVSWPTDPAGGTQGPGGTWRFLLALSPAGTPRTTAARQVSGRQAPRAAPRDGEGAVGAAHRTGAGGAGRPKRPTGGQAPAGSASAGRRQGRVGMLRPNYPPDPSNPSDFQSRVLDAFRQGLRDLGYVEGQTILLEPLCRVPVGPASRSGCRVSPAPTGRRLG